MQMWATSPANVRIENQTRYGMLLLGYGQFDSLEFWDMFWETFPFFTRVVLPALVCYIACSVLAAYVRLHLIGFLVFVLLFVLVSTQLFVLGAYGPAHVGMETGFWAWPIFAIALIGKIVTLHIKSNSARCRRERSTTNPSRSRNDFTENSSWG